MPSFAFTTMESMLRAARANPPAGLQAERRLMAEHAARFQPVPGVRAEPADALRKGSYLMTPDGVRDDVVILYIHGGGFRAGTAGLARGVGAQLALGTRARVVLPEYRLAPEDPFPAALDDCEAAFAHAASLAPRVVVAGESAGANLAAGVLLRRAAVNDTRLLAGVLYSGIFDQRQKRYDSGSWVEHADTDVVLSQGDKSMSTDYLAEHPDDDPLASPVLADLAGLPPLFIQASSAELLLDDSLELAARAARAGVHVELEIWPKMIHAWQLAAGSIPESTEAAERTAVFLNRVAEGRIVDGAAL